MAKNNSVRFKPGKTIRGKAVIYPDGSFVFAPVQKGTGSSNGHEHLTRQTNEYGTFSIDCYTNSVAVRLSVTRDLGPDAMEDCLDCLLEYAEAVMREYEVCD